jgi:hypothetical protein
MKTLLVSSGVVVGSVMSPGNSVKVACPDGSSIVTVPDDHPAAIGWLCPDGTEATLEYAPARRLIMTPMEFINLFPVQVENAIRESTNPIVVGWLRRVDHPALKSVDLSLEVNRNGVLYLVSENLMTQEQAETVLEGVTD